MVLQAPPDDACADLAQVVRRDVGGHSDRDADGPVDEQVRDPRREDDGFLGLAVVVVEEVDSVFLDVLQHRHGQRGGEPALGVAHRRGGVVAARTEVALPVDQRVAHRPRLGQPDQAS